MAKVISNGSVVDSNVRIDRPKSECRIPVAVIRRAIEAGETPAAVGARYGFTSERVRKHALDLGMKFASACELAALAIRRVPSDAEMVLGFSSGLPVSDLAESWDVSNVTAYKHRNRLAKAGRLVIDENSRRLVDAYRLEASDGEKAAAIVSGALRLDTTSGTDRGHGQRREARSLPIFQANKPVQLALAFMEMSS